MKTRDVVMGGVLLALGILLPSLFHMTGINGAIFSPMHIPVLLGGFILGPAVGLLIGILTPILNFLFSGKPIIPFLWVMIIELGLYGLIAGLFYKLLKNVKWGIIISLIGAMILGRLGAGFGAYILANLFKLKLNALIFLKGAFITALPGIIVHVILIPILISAYNANFMNNINHKA